VEKKRRAARDFFGRFGPKQVSELSSEFSEPDFETIWGLKVSSTWTF